MCYTVCSCLVSCPFDAIPIHLFQFMKCNKKNATHCGSLTKPRPGKLLDPETENADSAGLTRFPINPPTFAHSAGQPGGQNTFESTAWAAYNVAYRRQAANQRTLDWGVLDSGLYNDAFTGRAKAIPRCSYCLADTHHSRDCPDAPGGKQGDAGIPGEAKLTRTGPRPVAGSAATASVEICRLFNSPGGNCCKYPRCRYAHLCHSCHAPHPVVECGDQHRGPYNRPPMPPRPGDLKLPHPGAETWPPR